jgi:xylose dehydrogenase (NAD/NADP)
MPKIRWGLLSTANINKAVIPAIRASARGELMAVASRNQSAANQYAAQWEIPKAFGSYEEMLSSDEIEAVYIGLPNHLHAEWSIRAMQAGKHVLCEKPLAISLDEVDRMAAASEGTGRVLAEAFMYLHHPQTQLAREIVQRGDIGDICVVRGVFNFSMHSRDNIRLVPEYGGGSLWDVGVYPMSFAQYINDGPPAWVFGDQWLGESRVDETFAGQLHYARGSLAQITCAFRSPQYTLAEVIGTQGRLLVNRPFVRMEESHELWVYDKNNEVRRIPVPDEYLYQGEIEDLHDAVLEGKPPRISLQQSRDHIRTILALYESAREGRIVGLE